MLSRFLLHKITTHICPPLRYDLSIFGWTLSGIGPVHSYSSIFESATFSFRIQKFFVYTYPHSNRICPSTRIRIHSSTQDSSGNIDNTECVVKHAKFVSCSAFHDEELGLILLRHRIKKYPNLASTRLRINSVFKNFHSGKRIQKVADSYAGFTGYVAIVSKSTIHPQFFTLSRHTSCTCVLYFYFRTSCTCHASSS